MGLLDKIALTHIRSVFIQSKIRLSLSQGASQCADHSTICGSSLIDLSSD